MIRSLALVAPLVLVACADGGPRVSRFLEADLSARDAPPDAAPGTCWARETTPALIETVTEQVQVAPAGRAAPATYRTETRQAILRDRDDIWFETPCPEMVTPAFVASLQRALRARGYHRGPVTGEVDDATRRAIRRYQAAQSLHSDALSLAAAKRLGLVAYERDEALAAPSGD
ncbi:Putative peptidoglycan binding domain-containing protein [Tranquillimonas rosea]|uniref:Putative peptidoglycan binding domain-containing protein n=1 Tax=Tranquillimonas rosea TaxID=641238 RepID=A0A1H9WDX1_9RHOB|nr:peptidoglycan-binding domain-containing protein [Tranquillimonas rosea]SES32110.1 Putative peptidoglycan binding domain-containing protein [Tranquillimonas rosea]